MLLYNTKPKPKWAVTKFACNFSLITIAPNVIWPTTVADAMTENILVDLSECFPLSTNAIVKNTKSPVEAAAVL